MQAVAVTQNIFGPVKFIFLSQSGNMLNPYIRSNFKIEITKLSVILTFLQSGLRVLITSGSVAV